MLSIGLTGGIGSGKSTATDMFSALGIPVIDADVIAHQLTAPQQPILTEIAAHFGEIIFDAHQHLNRRALRQIIFEHPKEKIWLESLLHPLIMDEIQQQKDAAILTSAPYCIISIPLLIETNLPATLFDRILVIDADPMLQAQRVKIRDNLQETQISQIIQSQFSRKQRLDKADDIIENNTDLNTLRDKITAMHHYYLTLSKS